MDQFFPLLGIVGALSAGVVSPGPSFVMVARTAAASSRVDGLYAAIGMGLGGLCFAALALGGLQAVLLAVPSLYFALKVFGGAYLCYLGWRIFRGARESLEVAAGVPSRGSTWRSLALGWTAQISNPKTAIVYASVFAAFLPTHFSATFAGALLAIVFAVEAGWYAIVAMALSTGGSRRIYLHCKAWVDRAAGTVMVLLGLKLVVSAWAKDGA